MSPALRNMLEVICRATAVHAGSLLSSLPRTQLHQSLSAYSCN